VALQEAPSTPVIEISRAGLVEYEQALAMQRQFHQEVVAGTRPN